MNNLLFINQTMSFGGAEVFNSDLLNWLKNTQKFYITAYVTQNQLLSELKSSGITAYKIHPIVDVIGNWKGLIKGVLFLPILFYKYYRIINEHKKVNLIFMTGFIEKIMVTPLAKMYKIPVYWLEFAPLSSIFSKHFGLPRALYSLVETLPNKIIVPSQNTAHQLLKTTRILPAKLSVIPLARNIKENFTDQIVSDQVICVSRLEPGKGQDLLLQAWSEVSKKYPRARLLLVGGGDFMNSLVNLASILHISDSVSFAGEIPNQKVLALIASSEICVFPTLWSLEGFGLVTLEAMSAGKPVIGFDFGPLPEIINSKTGILVPSGDTKAMAGAILKLLKNKPLGKKMGNAGRNMYNKNYSFAKIGPKYVEIFTSTDQSV